MQRNRVQVTSTQELRELPENSVHHVTLKEGLRTLPDALLRHRKSIEFLDLSGNELSELPNWLAELQRLRVLFASYNLFTSFPTALRSVSSLTMVGMRNNQIEIISDNAFPRDLRWLTLTNNRLRELPTSIGELASLQKLLLAGNELSTLPESITACQRLELLRLSANAFSEIPTPIFKLESLAWIALGGNPWLPLPSQISRQVSGPSSKRETIDWRALSIQEELGRGASGITYRALQSTGDKLREVAVKVFTSPVSSDGSARDEIEGALAIGKHPSLLTPHAEFTNHPDGKMGLVYPLLDKSFTPLAAPPTFETISRDDYSRQNRITTEQARLYRTALQSAVAHLNQQKILHGDLYGHNTLINDSSAMLSDFGASFFYGHLKEAEQEALQTIEARALATILAEITHLSRATN